MEDRITILEIRAAKGLVADGTQVENGPADILIPDIGVISVPGREASLVPLDQLLAIVTDPIVLTIAKDVTAGVVANWLYQQLKKAGKTAVVVDGKKVPVSAKHLQTLVEKKAPAKRAKQKSKCKKNS